LLAGQFIWGTDIPAEESLALRCIAIRHSRAGVNLVALPNRAAGNAIRWIRVCAGMTRG
jgi:hypothetical protein